MPYSYAVYTGNGATTQFTVPFPYLRREHVVVSLNYVSTVFTWVNNTTVQVSPAPANGVRVEVRRVTPVNNPLVDFTDGSTLVAADLDTNALQQTYINQEQDDQFQDAVFINAQGLLDAGGQRITNVGDPTAAQDAATKNYTDTRDALKVNKAGDTMTGPLAMSGQKITGLGDPTNAQDAATKTWVETATTSPLVQFRSIFYGAFATDQATDPYGNARTVGDQYFNTSSNVMRVWNGASWQDVSSNANVLRWRKTAVGGETSLSGLDDSGATLTYTVNLEFVYLNGVLLTRGVDYTATNGTSIDGLAALTTGDVVEALSYSSFNLVNVPANTVQFTQAGAGATTRTVEAKLNDVVSVKDFGAVGDGVTNDQAAIQAALSTGKNVFIPDGVYLFNTSISYTADGQAIYGSGNNSVLKSGSGSVYISSNSRDNISLHDLKVDGSVTNGGFIIAGGSSNVTISRVYWYRGGQRVWLFTCSSVKVLDCTFEGTGYGIIQQAGHASSFVLVSGCLAMDMEGDFVEANCEGAHPSSSWAITNNVYKGSQGYPTTATEKRFVGITSVNGVVIDGNVVEKVAGDAAVHLENTLGETVVSNNVFDNCLGSGGNNGYIYLLASSENTVISANIFLRTDPALPAAYAVQCNNNYSNTIQFTGNRVVGTSAGCNFNGPYIADYDGRAIISDNIFDKLNLAVDASRNARNVIFSGNYVNETALALVQQTSSAGSGYRDWLISGNVFAGTTGTNDIFTSINSNATAAPKRLLITGNKFCKQVAVSGWAFATPNSENDATDIQVTNNVFSSTASLSLSGVMSRRVSSGNVFESTGAHELNATSINIGGTLPASPNAAISSAGAGQLTSLDVVSEAVRSTGQVSLSTGGTLDLALPGASIFGYLYVASVRTASANTRTYAIYFVATRLGNLPTITLVNSANGSGASTFTVTDISTGGGNAFRFTDTSGQDVTATMTFVGSTAF